MHRVWKGLLKNLARDVPPWQRHSVLSLSASLHQSPPRSETQVSFESEKSHKNASGQQTRSPAPVGWLTPLLICQTYCPPRCSHCHQAQKHISVQETPLGTALAREGGFLWLDEDTAAHSGMQSGYCHPCCADEELSARRQTFLSSWTTLFGKTQTPQLIELPRTSLPERATDPVEREERAVPPSFLTQM